ncbi:hypothetical protein AMTR_s00102p00049840 [Amborella trichopoda]|uniref:Uncharacterized protein n=1 Tax=Amborella trichopoda TaxID=13333 RepID=W1NYX8_AMBTC|nr:hypothetical protein AMTR_s00102p00049840 [Amborella trichopoda]
MGLAKIIARAGILGGFFNRKVDSVGMIAGAGILERFFNRKVWLVGKKTGAGILERFFNRKVWLVGKKTGAGILGRVSKGGLAREIVGEVLLSEPSMGVRKEAVVVLA